MGLSISTTSRRKSTGRIGQGAICGGFQLVVLRYASFSGYDYWLVSKHRNRPRTPSIHILDDDSLLHIFYLYRPFLLGEDEDNEDNGARRLWGGNKGWARERWWYRLAHVCRRWRNIILGSPSYLDLSLVCTFGTPVADMLAHSPHLPLVVDYLYITRDITTDDEEGIIFALKQRERILRVRLHVPVTSLQKFVAAMDDEYPILEFLVINLPIKDKSTILIFPETLQAPHLRSLDLRGFALPIGCPLLTTAVGLVTLSLWMVHPSTYFQPSTLLQWILLMPQLEMLAIHFGIAIPSRDVERPLTDTPIIAHVTFPNLRHFQFHGVPIYLEALVHRITTPHLKTLIIDFFNQLTFVVPCLLQFMDAAENLRFRSAKLEFFMDGVKVTVYLREEAEIKGLAINVFCWHLDWQVSSMAQVFNSLSQVFSTVEHLTLVHYEHSLSSEEHNEVERTEWRRLLRPFSNVKTLRIENGIVEELSRCLKLEDGELPLEVLPELQELRYPGSGNIGDGFAFFVDARRNAGRPITLVRL